MPQKDWIQTALGQTFDFTEPKVTSDQIGEIAHALSQICRFTGHVRTFYSVAQHCCHVSDLCSPANKAYGLLHDAHEAFVGDVSTPLKRLIGKGYQRIEKVAEHAVLKAFGLLDQIPDEVKRADRVMLSTEVRDLFYRTHPNWSEYLSEPALFRVIPWHPEQAKLEFLRRFEELFA